MENAKEFVALWDAGRIQRFHTIPTGVDQNLADHTFGILLIIDNLFPDKTSLDLYRYVLYHDLGEQATGDIPSPSFKDNQELHDVAKVMEDEWLDLMKVSLPILNRDQFMVFSICDSIECYMRARLEMRKGNSDVAAIAHRAKVSALEKAQLLREYERVSDFFEKLEAL